MVCKELKMNFNAAFVHNYPVVHTCFIGSFFFFFFSFFKYFSKQIGNILGITLFLRRRKN